MNGIFLRKGTTDEGIWASVYERNEYKLNNVENKNIIPVNIAISDKDDDFLRMHSEDEFNSKTPL